MIPVRSGALLVALSVLSVWSGCKPAEASRATSRREWAFEILGDSIARRAPRAAVLLVGNPFGQVPGASSELREAEELAARGLRRGLGERGNWLGVDYPELRADARANPHGVSMPAGITTPISFMTAPGAWDVLAAKHASARVLVSLVGVPADLAETKAWTDPAGPQWVFYLPDLRLLGAREAVRAAFREKRLLAIVLARPGAPPESEPLGRDRAAEVEKRYLLVTAENLEERIAAWPRLFP